METATALKISLDAAVRATLGPLQRFLSDPEVFELRINRYGEVVCDTTSRGRLFHAVPEVTPTYVKRLTNTLLHYDHKTIEAVNDIKLPDNIRGVICLPPAVVDGTVALAFRKQVVQNKTVMDYSNEGLFKGAKREIYADAKKLLPLEEDLLRTYNSCGDDFGPFLTQAVKYRRNIAIAGVTGSGKTTFTNALMRDIPADERLVILEDVHEAQATNQREAVYMMYCAEDGEGRPLVEGRIGASQCIKACMRLTPDRIMLTELRDDAAYSFMEAAGTGHRGAIFSTHAESAAQTPERIADLIKDTRTGRHREYSAILKKVRQAVDVVVYMEKYRIVTVLYDPVAKRETSA